MKKITSIAVIFSLLLGALSAHAGKDGWLTNFDDALAKAKAEGKHILLEFHGSDWCPPCIKLNKEVFTQDAWKSFADAELVLVDADFPRKFELPEGQLDHNNALAKKFEVQYFPTILIIGTSMSAGKTVTGRRVCEILSTAGLDVVGAKLTGAGRYRDVVSFRQAGARTIFDFVDVGLPSTVVPEDEFREAIRPLLSHIGSLQPDFLVAETGASPLEPYNVGPAIEELGDNIACILLAASDPYAVVGVEKAFGVKPDLVTGPAANTSAAISLVRKLADLPAINVIDRDTLPEFAAFLETRLGRSLLAA